MNRHLWRIIEEMTYPSRNSPDKDERQTYWFLLIQNVSASIVILAVMIFGLLYLLNR